MGSTTQPIFCSHDHSNLNRVKKEMKTTPQGRHLIYNGPNLALRDSSFPANFSRSAINGADIFFTHSDNCYLSTHLRILWKSNWQVRNMIIW